MKKQILIRADDLGYSEGVNYGIAKSVIDGVIRSVGVMINMPFAEHGLKLLKNTDVCLGLHTNICVGKPLSDSTQLSSLLQENGFFKNSKEYRNAKKDFVVLEQAVQEVETQYHKFVELTGRKPDYLDGHAVTSENFCKAMRIVAEKYQCNYLDFTLDAPILFKNATLFAVLESMQPNYNPFESLKRNASREYPNQGICMFICHPGYLDAFLMKNSSLLEERVKEVEMASNSETREWLEEQEIDIISFNDLK